MPKVKPHKGLLKRISITKTGKVRHRKAGSKHLRSAKAAKRLRRLRSGSYVSSASTRRLSKMIFRRLRGREQPLTAIRRSPSPAERKAKREAAKAAAAKQD
ncbi:MAG: bL35 family ribosomal protein [Planctomycetota bacterium]